MLRWIEEVLKPYLTVNPPPPGIVPVILLDTYRCHMMGSVTDAIADLGIEIISIPGGCTGLCQPRRRDKQAVQGSGGGTVGGVDDQGNPLDGDGLHTIL